METQFVNLDAAADAAGLGALVIIEAIQADRVHALEDAFGHLLVCSRCSCRLGAAGKEAETAARPALAPELLK